MPAVPTTLNSTIESNSRSSARPETSSEQGFMRKNPHRDTIETILFSVLAVVCLCTTLAILYV